MFENRNKMYGAYQLRKGQAHNTFTAWLFSIFILAALIFTIWYLGGPSIALIDTYTDKTKKEDVVYILPQISPPPLTTPAARTAQTVSSQGPPVVIDKKIVASIEPAAPGQPLLPLDIGSPPAIVPVGPPANASIGTPDVAAKPFKIVEVMPQYPGGEKELLKFIQQNIKYPAQLVDKGIGGTVYISFVINKNGEVSQLEILKGIANAHELATETMRVINKMPLWKPGMQSGQAVDVSYVLPVNFIAK